MKLPTNFSIKDIRNSKPVQTFKRVTSSNAFISTVAKIIITIVIWVGVLIPTWIYLLIRLIADPTGFWQELAVLLICMVVMGWFQVLLAFGGFFLTVSLLLDDTI